MNKRDTAIELTECNAWPIETAALAVAAVVTASPALVGQTFAAGSDIAVQVFLAIGVGLSPGCPTSRIRSGTAANVVVVA